MTQKELASAALVSQPKISQIENGLRNENFDLEALQRIAHALHLSTCSELVAFAEDFMEEPELVVRAEAFVKKHAGSRWHATDKTGAAE